MSSDEVPATEVSNTPCINHDWVHDGNGGWICLNCDARLVV